MNNTSIAPIHFNRWANNNHSETLSKENLSGKALHTVPNKKYIAEW